MTKEDPSIQESLLQLSIQLGHPLDQSSVEQLYQNALDLLTHISPTPVTLARVAGTLLVYHIQDPEGDELKWFKTQIEQCLDEEEVEESIESLHRTDAL
ncbi:hypothetical protein [Chamaesiphon sp.]|uniref:hypothetical protein n=1 Tax=Chamaesiphon sp. TaxID=2814140 RepID=UPI0035943712